MANNVFLILQDNEDARPIVEAIEQDNADVSVDYQPAMIRIESPGKLVVNRATVEELKGCDWNPQELHLVLVSLAGNVDEDDDHFTLHWNK